MGIYGEEKDYEELIKENIEFSKLIYNLKDSDKKLVKDLWFKKNEIKKKNSIFSTFQINHINKKIENIIKRNRT